MEVILLIHTLRPYLLMISAISFGLGITLPLVRFEKLYFFSETPSLLGIVSGLWSDGGIALAIIVALFSILFPIIKMGLAFQSAIHGGIMPAWANMLSKWSMMDVLLVALVVFAAKTSGLATAISQPGIWFYALSVVVLAVASLDKN